MTYLLWLLFPCMEIFTTGKKNLKNISYKFLVIIPFALLQSRYFNLLRSFRIIVFLTNLLKCLLWIDTRRLHLRIVVPKLQSLVLRVTRRDVLLVHFIVANVPISPQKYRMIWHVILLRSLAPQNLISPSSVNYVMQNFPAFIPYVNTETLNMDHNWDSERAILMWRISWEMLTIKVWEKKWNLANTTWQKKKWRMEDTESSTFPCHPSTCLCSTINWIMYSKNWNVLQKLTLHLDSFWKILRMECVDTFTLTRTILLWKDLNFYVHKLIWLTWKTDCRKWILLIFVAERDPIQSGIFTNLQI